MARCVQCGAELTAGTRFCVQCGAAVPAPAPISSAVSPPPAAAGCAKCGAPLIPGQKFCEKCGAAVTVQSPAAGGALDRNPLIGAGIALFAAAVVSAVGWLPLSMPARIIQSLVPPGDCTAYEVQTTQMYWCSAKVAALTLVGPLVVTFLLVVFRGAIARGVDKLRPKIPPAFRFLLGPSIATLCFTLSWSAIHYQTADLKGLLPQRIFPAVIGLFTFAMARFGPKLQQVMPGFFAFRDKIPTFLRFVVAMLIPAAVALVITYQERVSETALKEQVVVLLSVCCGYLALTPRHGNLFAKMQTPAGPVARKP